MNVQVGQFSDTTAKVGKLIPGKEYEFRVKAVNLQVRCAFCF